MTEVDATRVPFPEAISLRDNPLRNIRFFKRQWKYFCIATGLNRVSIERKVATFFLCIGREALTFIDDHMKLTDDEMKDCDKILTALENSHKPITNAVYERFIFNQTVQEDNDTIDSFISKLRKLAESCEFKEKTEEMIRDRFIIGLKNKELQKELLSEYELSLPEAVRLCKHKESVERNTLSSLYYELKSIRDQPNQVHSTSTPFSDVKSQQRCFKVERIEDDDDLIVLSHSPDQPHFVDVNSHRPRKRSKTEMPVLKTSTSCEETHNILEGDFEELEQFTDGNNSDIDVGSFVVLKDDWSKFSDPPVWKVDSRSLLQKFIPVEHNGVTMYKSTAVYSGWSLSVRDQYYKAPVAIKNKSSRKDAVVKFLKDRLPIENKIESHKKSL